MTYGQLLRISRENLGYNLREFCREFGYDPANWSKMETGERPAPKDREALIKIKDQLKIEDASYFDLACLTRNNLPEDLWGKEDDFIPFFERLRHG